MTFIADYTKHPFHTKLVAAGHKLMQVISRCFAENLRAN